MQFDLLHDILVCWTTEERTLSYMLSAQKAKRLEHVFIWKVERTSRPEYPDPDLQSSHSIFHYFRLRWHELRILDIELVDIARVELPSGSTPKLWGVLTPSLSPLSFFSSSAAAFVSLFPLCNFGGAEPFRTVLRVFLDRLWARKKIMGEWETARLQPARSAQAPKSFFIGRVVSGVRMRIQTWNTSDNQGEGTVY